MFDIREYMYDIYAIGAEEDMDSGVALDMFVANVRNYGQEGLPMYGKSTELDYAALANELSDPEVLKEARLTYRRVNYAFYKDLATAYGKRDRDAYLKAAMQEVPESVKSIVG